MKLLVNTLFFFCAFGVLQAQHIEVSRNINVGLFNHWGPSVTGAGDVMIYISNHSESGNNSLFISENKHGWTTPEILPREINTALINYELGHFLTFSGDRLYMTNRRNSNGRGYNIWYHDRTENGWGRAELLGPKINTTKHEGAPSITPDGKVMYFVRCDQMTAKSVNGCKIYRSFLVDDDWDTPELVDLDINTGIITCPRIFPDKKTLVFSAAAPGGAGGYDMYYTKEQNGRWSKPVPMSFMNTPNDETMVSPGVYGYRIHYGKMVNGNYKIVQQNLPPEFRGEDTYIMNLSFKSEVPNGRVLVFVTDKNSGEMVLSEDVREENVTLVLNEGREYTLFVKSAKVSNQFYTRTLDLTDIERTNMENIEINLSSLGRDEMIVEGLKYNASDPYIEDNSGYILNGLKDFIKTNPGADVEIEIVMDSYQEDTIQSPGLTEVLTDSMRVEVVPSPESFEQEPMDADSLSVSVSDSIEVEIVPQYIWEYTYRYHNDRSEKEAEELRKFLKNNGVDVSRVKIHGVRETSNGIQTGKYLRVKLR